MGRNRFLMPVAVHLFLMKDERILLLRRYNTGYEDGKYSVIAGHLDGDEEVKAAMIREAKEEAGIDIAVEDMEIIGVMHRKSEDERIDYFLTAKVWKGEIVNKEPEKCDALAWFHLQGLPDNVIPYVRKAISNFQEGIRFDSFGW